MNKLKRQTMQGFTLIEVMIAVTIVAIVASKALPSYTAYIARAQRSDATISLENNAQRLQACFTATGDYSDAGCAAVVTPISDRGFYNITVVTPNANSYTLSATPVAGGPRAHDSDCASFTRQNTGRTEAEDNGGTPNDEICLGG